MVATIAAVRIDCADTKQSIDAPNSAIKTLQVCIYMTLWVLQYLVVPIGWGYELGVNIAKGHLSKGCVSALC